MKYYLAPMEGITGYVYRNAFHRHFGGADRYFTPFISPHRNKAMTSRERNDVLPEHNRGMEVIPQILSNDAEAFGAAMDELFDLGYREVNVNLGCPSGTVAAKGKGAGFLAGEKREELSRFLDSIFDRAAGMGMEISIKTRLGKESREGFSQLVSLFLRFPVSELIVHPRVQTDFYKNAPDWGAFGLAARAAKEKWGAGQSVREPGFEAQTRQQASGEQEIEAGRLCYNGDIFTPGDLLRFRQEFPQVERVMAGRGAIANPGLFRQMREEESGLTKERLLAFHDEVFEGYREAMGEDRNALFKMKELWTYLLTLFPRSEKQAKKIRKAGSADSYLAAVGALFEERELCADRYFKGF